MKTTYSFHEHRILSSRELADAVFTVNPCDKSEHPFRICGEWYCCDEDCAIREVCVNLKFPDGDAPDDDPILKCPGCGSVLKFHHFLTTRMLLKNDNKL